MLHHLRLSARDLRHAFNVVPDPRLIPVMNALTEQLTRVEDEEPEPDEHRSRRQRPESRT